MIDHIRAVAPKLRSVALAILACTVDGECREPGRDLAELAGINIHTFLKRRAELQAAGLIVIEPSAGRIPPSIVFTSDAPGEALASVHEHPSHRAVNRANRATVSARLNRVNRASISARLTLEQPREPRVPERAVEPREPRVPERAVVPGGGGGGSSLEKPPPPTRALQPHAEEALVRLEATYISNCHLGRKVRDRGAYVASTRKRVIAELLAAQDRLDTASALVDLVDPPPADSPRQTSPRPRCTSCDGTTWIDSPDGSGVIPCHCSARAAG